MLECGGLRLLGGVGRRDCELLICFSFTPGEAKKEAAETISRHEYLAVFSAEN